MEGDLLAVASCGGNETAGPTANAEWIGIWNLTSVNGTPVPANISLLGYPTRVVSRRLEITTSTQLGFWRDSTLSSLLCNPPTTSGTMCNASGSANITWSVSGITLSVARGALWSGYAVGLKTFVLQGDATLLKTDDSQTEVYRKQ